MLKKLQYVAVLLVIGILAFNAAPASVTVFSVMEKAYAKAGQMKKLMPLTSVDVPDKKIAMSFDLAFETGDITKLMVILAENNVRATFFVSGMYAKKYPEMIRMITDMGHEIGSLGDGYVHGKSLGADQIRTDIRDAHDRIYVLTGIHMNLYRPPFGEYNNTVIETAGECGYMTVLWDSGNLKNGSIITQKIDTDEKIAGAGEYITKLKQQGYTIVPISELVIKSEFSIDKKGRQKAVVR